MLSPVIKITALCGGFLYPFGDYKIANQKLPYYVTTNKILTNQDMYNINDTLDRIFTKELMKETNTK